MALTIDEEGQARTAEHKVAVAVRLVETLTGQWGMRVEDIIVDCLTFPIATGQEETRRDGIETIEAIREVKRRYPTVQTTLGVSNVSFGLNPAARRGAQLGVPARGVKAGLDSAIVHAAKILPMARIPEEQRQVALDLVYDRRRYGDDGYLEYDPLQRFLDLFEGVDAAAVRADRAAELAALPLAERLPRRIVDGERQGPARPTSTRRWDRRHSALDIINDDLLAGMRTVGELFGRGEMQLPVRAAVGRGDEGRGRAPGAAHRRQRTPPAARARSCWPRSRATCTTSARTWSTSSCPTTATTSSTSGSSSRCPRSCAPPRSTAPT